MRQGLLQIEGGLLGGGGALVQNQAHLKVNGRVAGPVEVASGGMLSGTGTVGAAGSASVIRSGGMLAPGNSVGTLKVQGDLRFEPGSVYQVEANAQGQADLVEVAGIATLGGMVGVRAEGGQSFEPRTAYTIVRAGQVRQAFQGAMADYEFLDPQLTYTQNQAILTLVRKDRPGQRHFHDAAVTPNQYAAADGIESLPSSHAVYRHVETLPQGQAARALDALSGEGHASARAAIQGSADLPRERSLRHLRANLGAGRAPGAFTARAGVSDAPPPASSLPQSRALPLWAEMVGAQQQLGGDDNAAGLRRRTAGVFLGGDFEAGRGWRAGAALGYSDSRVEIDERSTRVDADSYSLTLLAGRAVPLAVGNLNLAVGGGYIWHRLKSRRNTDASGLAQTLKASYDGRTAQLFGEIGYALPVGGQTSVEPFAGVAWSRLRTDGFTESGGSAALQGRGESSATTASTLGVRAQTRFEAKAMQGVLRATVGWRHAFGTLAQQARLSFAGGQTYTVQGAPIARDAAVLELGAELALSRRAALGLSYSGQFGKRGHRDHLGQVDVRWRF